MIMIRLLQVAVVLLPFSCHFSRAFILPKIKATRKCNSSRLSATTTTRTRTRTTVLGPRLAINENYIGLNKLHSNPDIFIIQNFLDESACRDLIDRAKAKSLDPSPVAYAGWTEDFTDLVELAVKGPVTWLAIIFAWIQVKDDVSATQIDLVIHCVQNFGVLLVIAVSSIAAFLKFRTDGLKEMRTSTSTTLDDISDIHSGTTQFVKRAAHLFGGVDSESSIDEAAALFESPTVIRYEAGQILKPHFDANRSADKEDANRGGQTLATLLVYLNDVEKGGLTRFGKIQPSGIHNNTNTNSNSSTAALTIQPKLGDALLFFPADSSGVFDERTEHEGCAAIDEKWIARVWRHANRVPPPFGLTDDALNLL